MAENERQTVNFDSYREIVVGIDGSEASNQALSWAVEEAKVRGASIKIVHAWEYPALAYGAYANEGLDLEAGGKEILTQATDLVNSIDKDVSVTTVLREGNPVPILSQESEHSDLLVVGSRGHGGFASLVLGSVSSQLAHHTKTTLVIVRNKH
ncbi:Nucleotide-binding universal stress protein, UspA family [Ferrithrix thermotolerans DSM 19514]|jgi:nucleotide-binding universal stress UspA family protein|uniref:Nucleotide-binding universal stress protein, UspA family n=1 Tax=Ferrithrix thermotolerans DSM 19514 TaxID=1121881 RepID=A0A1M4WUB4_9ACTN|nr:universal stress protein [Ferrithrix thermotolerans]SHE84552.1 Nucleotide-binding universal stress protein, UspA family [Ferrithrix thermotolerans DSM 19514]